jgi:hypothetical protein
VRNHSDLIHCTLIFSPPDAKKDISEKKCSLSATSIVCIVDTETWLQGTRSNRTFENGSPPPDPSTNHNTACDVYQNAPPTWFFEAGVFKGWMSNGSFLWVHGKRTFLSYFAAT